MAQVPERHNFSHGLLFTVRMTQEYATTFGWILTFAVATNGVNMLWGELQHRITLFQSLNLVVL